MAAVADIFRFMDQIAPFEMQEDFDNAGFLVGRGNQAVQKILVALDITGEVAAALRGKDASRSEYREGAVRTQEDIHAEAWELVRTLLGR